MDDRGSLKDLVDFMARALVDDPSQVDVQEVEGQQASVIELRVAQADLGKVIGKQGRTAKAMRAILAAASVKQSRRATLEILD